MGVIVAKRGISKLQFYTTARELRRELMKALDVFFRKEGDVYIHDPLFAERELKAFDELCRKLMTCIIAANSIYPKYFCELEQRQLLQSRAIGYAECIYQELEWMVDLFPERAGFFAVFSDKATHEVSLLRRWKKANNKIKVVGYEPPEDVDSED